MQQTRTLIFTIFASIIVTASGPHAASAQDASTASGYQFFVTPYLWLASVHATTKTPLARVPERRAARRLPYAVDDLYGRRRAA